MDLSTPSGHSKTNFLTWNLPSVQRIQAFNSLLLTGSTPMSLFMFNLGFRWSYKWWDLLAVFHTAIAQIFITQHSILIIQLLCMLCVPSVPQVFCNYTLALWHTHTHTGVCSIAWQGAVCQFPTPCTFDNNESIWCENMQAFPPSHSPAVSVRENISGISQQVCLTFSCLFGLSLLLSSSPLHHTSWWLNQEGRWSWPGHISLC